MFIRFFFLLILGLNAFSSHSFAENKTPYKQNRPDKDFDDFFGYNPKNATTIERNPWGFHEFWWIGPVENGPYTLQVANDDQFKELIYFQTVNRYYDFTRHLPDGKEVYWRVLFKERKTPAYKVKLIPTRQYQVSIEEPIITPFDLEKKIAGSILLRWKEKSGTGPYDVEVSPDPKFSTLVFRQRVRGQEFKIDKFAEAGLFFWRVKLGKFSSPIGQFRINQSMINAAIKFDKPYIQLVTPLNGDSIDSEDTNMDFKWQDLGYKTQYKIEIARTGDFAEIVFSQDLKETNISIPTFAEQGTYFWRVTSSQFESPVHSFNLAPSANILQQGLSLFSQIFLVKTQKNYFFSADYRLSSMKGNDLDNSTSGTLVADQYYVLSAGMVKRLYPTWNFEWSVDYSLIDRRPPDGLEIRNSVNGLVGLQAGVWNLVLKDFQAGLFLRYSEFELLRTITGTFFETDKGSAMSVGGGGQYKILKWTRLNSQVGAHFYSTLPFFPEIGRAFVAHFFLDLEFKMFSNSLSRVGLYYQSIGVVSDDSSQASDASGLRVRQEF